MHWGEITEPRICSPVTKKPKICITGVPEGEEKASGAERILEEIIAKYVPNLAKT